MQENVDLTTLTTLKVPARATRFVELTDFKELPSLIQSGVFQNDYLLLGQGANILFTKDYPGTVIKITVPGYRVISETDTDVLIEASAGQDWHQLVMWTVEHNWSGMENMALIPGTVGAAVVGNIAAYGQNQQTILEQIEVFDLARSQPDIFSCSDCSFAYRESIFKQKEYKKCLVTSARYRLKKNPKLETSYRATRHASLLPELERIAKPPYTVKDVASAVINLRTSKLPDCTKVGTAGSFFKNPVVPRSQAEELKKTIPDLQFYPAEKLSYIPPSQLDQYVKLPAGQLLDELGWRGKRVGNVGTYPSHALVVCNFGGATGAEVYEFSENMRTDVKKHFGIDLRYEILIV